MESDYRTVMREEFLSKKAGIQEDLEDMRMEAEEKKLKDMRKKKKFWSKVVINSHLVLGTLNIIFIQSHRLIATYLWLCS